MSKFWDMAGSARKIPSLLPLHPHYFMEGKLLGLRVEIVSQWLRGLNAANV